MNGSRTRLEHARRTFRSLVAVTAAAVALAGCEEESTPSSQYIPLTQPLTITWVGPIAQIGAAASLRVDWTVLIESVPASPTSARARHRRTFNAQEMIAFAWDKSANVSGPDFSPGDSCVATVSYPQLDPAEPGARVAFRLP